MTPHPHTIRTPHVENRRIPRPPSSVRLDIRFLRLPLAIRLLTLAVTKAR
jgi:hypothetical protein